MNIRYNTDSETGLPHIYSQPDSVFVITAYDLKGKP